MRHLRVSWRADRRFLKGNRCGEVHAVHGRVRRRLMTGRLARRHSPFGYR